MKRRLLLAVLLVLLQIGGCSRGPPDLDAPETRLPVPADYPQVFHTAGNRILDAAGRPRILRGVAVPEVLWLAQRQDDQIGFFDRRLFRRAAEWQANVVRLSVLPALYREHGPGETLRVLDWSVAYARRYGLYLIICFHGIGFPPEERYKSLIDWRYGELYRTNSAEIRDFWLRVAARYRHEPAVAFYELLNEPVRIEADGSFDYDTTVEDWRRWRDWVEQLADQIRAVDPAKPLIVGGLEFGYNLRWAASDPVRRPNVVYSSHPYSGADWHTGWETAFLGAAAQLPVIATEFGWGGSHAETWRNGVPYGQAILETFDAAGMGWTAWSFSHTFPPSLLADAREGTPTPFGAAIRAALLARSRGPAPAPAARSTPADPRGRRLGAAELQAAIAGNTESGPWGAIHYRPDGSMVAMSGPNRYPGRWRIGQEGRLCQLFPHIRGGQEVCFDWWLNGDRLTTDAPATGEGAAGGVNRIEPGNPYAL